MGSERMRAVQVWSSSQLTSAIAVMLRQIFLWDSNGCGLDIGVKDGRVVGVRGRVTDRVNKGRLGPKGLNG